MLQHLTPTILHHERIQNLQKCYMQNAGSATGPYSNVDKHYTMAYHVWRLTRPGLSKHVADRFEGAGPLTPLVTPLLMVAASLLRRLQLAAIHSYCRGLGQYCLNVSVCHWVLSLL